MYERAIELARETDNAAEIERRLQAEARQEAKRERPRFVLADVPSRPTIRSLVAEARDTSEPWALAHATGEEAAFLPRVLGAIFLRSGGAIRSVSRREAEWTMKMKQAIPAIPPAAAFLAAREYMRSENAGEDAAHLDLAIAVAAALGPPLPSVSRAEEEAIAAHVKAHVGAWIERPLCVWAGSPARLGIYVAEIGEHASLAALVGGEDADWFVRLYIELGKKEERS